MDKRLDHLKSFLSPTVRGGVYYALQYGTIALYFTYFNLALIERGITGVQLGIFNSTTAVIGLIFAPRLANFADLHHARVKMLSILTACFGAVVFLYSFFYSFWVMWVLVAIGAIFQAPLFTTSDSIQVRMAASHGLDYGKIRMWGSISFLILSISSGWLWQKIGLEYLFVVSMVAYLLQAFWVNLLDEPSPMSGARQLTEKEKAWYVPLKDRSYLIFLLAIFFTGIAFSTFVSYVGIYVFSLTKSEIYVGVAMAMPAISEIFSMLTSRAAIRRFGVFTMLMIGNIFVVLFTFGVGFIYQPAVILISNFLRGFGFGYYQVSYLTFVDQVAPQELTSTYQSLVGVFQFSLPSLLVMPLVGYIYDSVGINAVFKFSGGLGFIGFLLLLLLVRGEKKKKAKLLMATDH
ncbi:MAG: MFS transporter [Anaerolineaceae bacterium]|nr:MFS transporter [Anaerolineaceae bacterium]